MTRRDRRGRRIGYNWWREYVVGLLRDADLDWRLRRDEVCIGYETEEREFALSHPRPTLKAFLIASKGMNLEPSGQ